MNRREFLESGALASGSAAARPVSAADRIGVAVIGCGGMGRMDQADFAKQPDVRIVAVCDVYEPNLARALEAAGGKAAALRDYRRVLENRDVDAVVIATPDHWHPLITVEACAAGKDVYVEKPVSHSIREGRLMVEAARRHGRVVQIGLQQRSGTHFQRAARMVREGQIGKVHFAECWNHEAGGPAGMGKPADSEPPAGLDWDFWLGPAPRVPFNRNRFLGSWRAFFDYGGGKLTDWGCHLIDIVQWAMETPAPLSAAASGGNLYLADNRDTPDTLEVVYEYPGFLLRYTSLQHNSYGPNGNPGNKPFGSYGILFHGTQGTLFVDRAGFEVWPQMAAGSDPQAMGSRDAYDDLTGSGIYYTAQGVSARGTTSVQHVPHVRNFLDCVKTRARPIADIEIGHQATATCHLGNIALRCGQKIQWDARAERITNVAAANAMLARSYRAPWSLPGL